MSLLYGFVRVLCKIVVGVGFRVKVSGIENFLKGEKLLLCSNHQSFWDMPILIAVCPYQIHFLAKKEIFKHKIFVPLLLKLGLIPINRGASDIKAVKNSEQALENGVLGVFPEGTRRPLARPEKAKAGAALMAMHTGSEILPAAINYNGAIKLFGRVNVRFGEILSAENYMPENTAAALPKTAIRALSNTISEEIIKLWETKE